MIRTTARLSLALGLIAASVCWIAHGLRIIPSSTEEVLRGRVKLSESIAIATSAIAEEGNLRNLESILRQAVERNPELMSAGVRRFDRLMTQAGGHAAQWQPLKQGTSTPEQMVVEILSRGKPWGSVELQFVPLHSGGLGWIGQPLGLVLFLGCGVSLLCWVYLSRALKYLNPSNVVPHRVRSAFDTLTEGLILMDPDQQIVLANEAFSEIVDIPPDDLIGSCPKRFFWEKDESTQLDSGEMPWSLCLRGHAGNPRTILALRDSAGDARKYIVNAAPILENSGRCKGVLASFDDVTDLENKRAELSNMLSILRASRDEIRRQNDQLQFLASRDSLTGCFNRRSFFEGFNEIWESKEINSLSVIMIDIDNFKLINDNYGHAVGDEVIRGSAQLLIETVGDCGVVCRYGGEEFCISLPNYEFEDAQVLAEKIRQGVASMLLSGISVTYSLGVSERSFGAMDPQHLLEQADQSLYVAKSEGRNRVVGWDQVSKSDLHTDPSSQQSLSRPDHQSFSSVSALCSVLSHRNQASALHSARVANMCSAYARKHLDEEAARIVQVAALLHEIGRIGIRDSGVFDDIEKRSQLDSISAQIATAADAPPEAVEIIRFQQVIRCDDSAREPIQLSPRIEQYGKILAICDQFDSQQQSTGFSTDRVLENLRRDSLAEHTADLIENFATLVRENPSCLQPAIVPTAHGKEGSPEAELASVAAAAEAGDLAELRRHLAQFRPELSTLKIQTTVEELREALSRNDEDLNRVVQLTQELAGLCQRDKDASSSDRSEKPATSP